MSALTNAALTTWLHGLPGVDQVGCEARAAALGTRSVKTTAKAWAIDTAISMIDLTTLEGADTEGKVRSLAAKAARPDPLVAGQTLTIFLITIAAAEIAVALAAVVAVYRARGDVDLTRRGEDDA